MPQSQRPEMRELVLSPQEHLVAGGPAEELEQQIQVNYRQGVQSIFVDMRAVPAIDSAGVRALVRGHTTAERLGRRFCLVGPNAKVRDVLRLSHARSGLHDQRFGHRRPRAAVSVGHGHHDRRGVAAGRHRAGRDRLLVAGGHEGDTGAARS